MSDPMYVEPNVAQLLDELRILHDHFAGSFKTMPMQTCHNAMTYIRSLESKLEQSDLEIQRLEAQHSQGLREDEKRDAEFAALQSRLEKAELDGEAGRMYAEGIAEAAMAKWEAAEERAKAIERRLHTLSTALEAIRGLANDFWGTTGETEALAQIKNIAGSDLVVERQLP